MNILERLIAERQGREAHRVVGDVPAPPPVTAPPPGSALAMLLQRTGQTIEQLRAQDGQEDDGYYGSKQRIDEVPHTREFERIRDLPRRPLSTGEALVDRLTDALSTPWGTMRLLPIQALAIAEIGTVGGLFGPIRVGAGKTLITYLAPTILRSKRPLLIVPAALKDKTLREFTELAKHWIGIDPRAYRIESYDLLGRSQSGSRLDDRGKTLEKGMLERYNPDLIILDEAHRVKNKSAASTRRIRRFLAEHPGVPVIALSGTMMRKSLKDCAHIAEWCLPRLTPIPKTYGDLEAWAGALDKTTDGYRVQPGALLELCTDEERAKATDPYGVSEEGLAAVRSAFQRRLVETPGVIATVEGPMDMSVIVRGVYPRKEDPKMNEHFGILRSTYETPTGIPISDGLTFKRHALEMALGFEYVWEVPAPTDWLMIRRAWSQVCRQILKNNRRGLDSEKQVTDAVKRGIYPGIEILREWLAIEPTFTPKTIPVWFSDEALDFAAAWASDQKGIVWTDHSGFGNALSKIAKIPYYRQKGLDEQGNYIENHKKGYPCIASIKSNSTGRNLQYLWSKNLTLTPPRSGPAWEQKMGRTHRDGQPEDEVLFDVYLACAENLEDLENALEEARMEESTQGQAAKLSYASRILPTMPELAGRGGPRWAK